MKRSVDAKGKTREEAIAAGLEALDLTIDEVTVEDIEEGSKGLFGFFGSRLWTVRVTAREDEEEKDSVLDTHSLFASSLDEPEVKNTESKPAPEKKKASEKKPEKREAAPAEKSEKAEKAEKPAEKKQSEKKPAEKEKKPAKKQAERKQKPVQESKPVTPAEQAEPGTAAGDAQAFLQDLTRLMGVEVSVHVNTDEEGNVRVNMEGDSQGILIGRRGETLDALQYLTSLKINKGKSDYTRVTLDTEGYRARREEALVRLANRMANRAVKTGRRVSIEPMNPYERRILHSALQGNPDVTTHSEGEEPNRHVVITVNKPQRNKKQAEKPAEEMLPAEEITEETEE
ncbi:MAG: Jag N-terminal domain-containing protein [Clostridia bacterium]|nr:Jag N-terminal domain-containing protein [Clostridia bacterium]MBR5383817.1 Jag N-terminal domain-containing protein [Clostridia bacterium]